MTRLVVDTLISCFVVVVSDLGPTLMKFLGLKRSTTEAAKIMALSEIITGIITHCSVSMISIFGCMTFWILSDVQKSTSVKVRS